VNDLHRHKILLVDDEPVVRHALGMVMKKIGYDVSTAADGYDALAQLRRTVPDIVISDLNMPRMSGFELFRIVRVRFPHIPLIAMSGAYDFSDHFPGGLIVDAVYPKGICRFTELEQIVADLIRATAPHANLPTCEPAQLQVPVFGNESGGELSIRLTCIECLRTFSFEFKQDVRMETQKAHCPFCAAPVRYVIRPLGAMLRKVFEAKKAVL
jgi:CheY-like chemotaxis protein